MMRSAVDKVVPVVPAIADMEDSIESSDRVVDGGSASSSSLPSLSARKTDSSTSLRASRKIPEGVTCSKDITIKPVASSPYIEKDGARDRLQKELVEDAAEIKIATSTISLSSASITHAMTDKEYSTPSSTPPSSPNVQYPSQKVDSNNSCTNHAVQNLDPQEKKEDLNNCPQFGGQHFLSKSASSYEEEEKKDDDYTSRDTSFSDRAIKTKHLPIDPMHPNQHGGGKTCHVQRHLKNSPLFTVEGSKLYSSTLNGEEKKPSVDYISTSTAFSLDHGTTSSTSSAVTPKASNPETSKNLRPPSIGIPALQKADTPCSDDEDTSFYVERACNAPKTQTLPSLIDGVTKALMLPLVSEIKRFPSDEMSENNSFRSGGLATSYGAPESYCTRSEDAFYTHHQQSNFSTKNGDYGKSSQLSNYMPEAKLELTMLQSDQRRQLKPHLRERHNILEARSWQEQLKLQNTLQHNLQQNVSMEQKRLQDQLRNVKPSVVVPIEMDQILKQEMDARWELRVARREIIQQLEVQAQETRGENLRELTQTQNIQDEQTPNNNGSSGVAIYDKYEDESESIYSYTRVCGLTRAQCLCWMFVMLSMLVIVSSTIIVTYVLTSLRHESESSLIVPTPSSSQVPYPETPPPVHESRKTLAPAPDPGPKSPAPSLRPTVNLLSSSKPTIQPTVTFFKENPPTNFSKSISVANSTELNNTMIGGSDVLLLPTFAPTSPTAAILNATNGTVTNTQNITEDQSAIVIVDRLSFNNVTNSSSSGLIEKAPTVSPTVEQRLDDHNATLPVVDTTNATNTTNTTFLDETAAEAVPTTTTGKGATNDENEFKSIFD